MIASAGGKPFLKITWRRCAPAASVGAHAGTGPAFPRCNARAVPLGGKGAACQDRSDGRRREPASKKGDGFIPWTEEHVAAYERRWQIGTRQRVWLDVLLYTGLRRGDAVRFGRQHVRNGVATIKTEKSNFTVTVTLPILPVLAETLAAGPCGDLTFIVGERGQPLTKESIRQYVPRCVCGGWRPGLGAWRAQDRGDAAANTGATVAQLEGHVRMERRPNAVPLHAPRRPQTPCA